MSTDLSVLLIVLLPLLGAAWNGLLPLFWKGMRRSEGMIGAIGTAVVAIPFVLTVGLFLGGAEDPHVVRVYTWMAAGDFSAAVPIGWITCR